MAGTGRKSSVIGCVLSAIALAGLMIAPTRVVARSEGAPLYIALGDSIEFGLGDDFPGDGLGYVQSLAGFLSSEFGQPAEVENLGEPGATTRDILLTQLPEALATINSHQGRPIIVSWGGGGNDVGLVALSRQAAACKQMPSCLARFNAVLNEAEQAIDRTISRLRAAAGPGARIFMRTQYNALLKSGCGTIDEIALGNATLEGAPGTAIDRGLNDRIRTIAARYDATVIDLFPTFAFMANKLVSTDCIHPNGLGYQTILGLYAASF